MILAEELDADWNLVPHGTSMTASASTIACSCGVLFERWVTPNDADQRADCLGKAHLTDARGDSEPFVMGLDSGHH